MPLYNACFFACVHAFLGQVFEAMKKLTFTSELSPPQKAFFYVGQWEKMKDAKNTWFFKTGFKDRFTDI